MIMGYFVFGLILACAVILTFSVGAWFGETMVFAQNRNTTPCVTNLSNWSHFDGYTTLIHCSCSDGGTSTVIINDKVPDLQRICTLVDLQSGTVVT